MYLPKYGQHSIWMVVLFFSAYHVGHAQTKVLKGIIRDAHSDERIPFASMQFKKGRTGKLSDSAGTFTFRFDDSWPKDTLVISYVGFMNYNIVFNDSLLRKMNKDTITLSILMERGKYDNEVVVMKKVD
ncbi:MAG TPA: carboxypeptidase-like regulatory domain-containing protein, partial [Puia sp.]|nr:carboxypeptidase-like regulatory domain-containing protein [Puia sp.]